MNDTVTDDTVARETLKQDAKALNIVQFWEQRADIELLQPRNRARPYRWNWSDIEPRLRVAARTVPIEECERRALVFRNPGIGDKPYITKERLRALEAPLQIHVGDKDAHVPMEAVAQIRETVKDKPNAEVFVYPGAGHGFFSAARPEAYSPEAAALAEKRVAEMFSQA